MDMSHNRECINHNRETGLPALLQNTSGLIKTDNPAMHHNVIASAMRGNFLFQIIISPVVLMVLFGISKR